MQPILQQKFEELEQAKQQLLDIIQQAKPEEQRFKPSPEEWCMLQVAQHLVVAEGGTVRFMQKRPPMPANFAAKLQAKAGYSLLTTAIKSPKKIKAPKIAGLNPTEILPLAETLANWAEVRENCKKYLSDFPKDQLDYFVFKHPLAGKLNVVQTLGFMIAHIHNHIRQVKQIQKAMKLNV